MKSTRKITWLCVSILLVAAALYHGKGLIWLFSERGGTDIHLRWQEQQYVMRGQNPYDITFAELGVGMAPWDQTRNTALASDVGIPDSGGYPPLVFFFRFPDVLASLASRESLFPVCITGDDSYHCLLGLPNYSPRGE